MKGFKRVERVQGVIILVSLLAFAMVLYSNWVTLSIFKHSERWDPVPEHVQSEVTVSRLSLERALGWDNGVNLQREILRPLERARNMCAQSIRGGDRSATLLKPIDERAVETAIIQVVAEIQKLEKLSTDRFHQRTNSLLQKAYTQALKDVDAYSQTARRSLVEIRNQERLVINAISWGSVVILFGLFAGLIEFVMRQHRVNKSLRLKQERQTALRAEVGLALAGNQPLRSALQSCAEALAMHFENALAQVWMVTNDGATLELQVSAGRVGRAHEMQTRVAIGSSRIGLIAKERTNFVSNDVLNDSEVRDAAVRAEKLPSLAACPLLADGRLVGVLALYSTEQFNDETLELMDAIADALAHGIERKRAEQKITEQAALLDKARDAIIVIDLDHRCVYWNKSAERLYGIPASEVTGKSVADVLFSDRSRFDTAIESVVLKGEWLGECAARTAGGNEINLESHWTLVHDDNGIAKSVLIVNTDVSDKKQFEAQLLRTQRVESIGTLAGGIAHDLNNVLAPVLMSVEMLRPKLTDEQSARMLSILEASAKRGAQMVKQILTFARGATGERVMLQPRQLIKEVAKMAKETFPKTIQTQVKLPENLWALTGDPTQLHQVLMNLAVNARDAMPNGGTLNFAAENVLLNEEDAKKYGATKAGCYVLLTVGDTGTGIPREMLDKIFDPFFTTKEKGKGTGLGLSTVMGIVKSHRGFLQVQSEINKGTQFRIYLPALESMVEHRQETELKRLPKGQGELLLLVDDELPFLNITKETLEAYGYRVLTATDGVEAVAAYAAHRNEIKGVFTDMLMPHMDGPATIRVLKRLDPSLKIVAFSGLFDSERVKAATGRDDIEVLTKPFSAENLLTTVHDTLN